MLFPYSPGCSMSDAHIVLPNTHNNAMRALFQLILHTSHDVPLNLVLFYSRWSIWNWCEESYSTMLGSNGVNHLSKRSKQTNLPSREGWCPTILTPDDANLYLRHGGRKISPWLTFERTNEQHFLDNLLGPHVYTVWLIYGASHAQIFDARLEKDLLINENQMNSSKKAPSGQCK